MSSDDRLHARIVSRVFLATIALLIAGCAVGPDYTPPAPGLPGRWHAPMAGGEQDTPAALTQWWEVFGDATLNNLVAEAAETNYDLRIAEARVREARAARGIVAADLYPQLNARASYQRSESPAPDSIDNTSLSLSGSTNSQSFSRTATLRSGDFTATGTSAFTRLGSLLLGQQGGTQSIGSALLPSNSANLSFSPNNSPSFERTQDFYQAGFDASWELDVFGGNRRAVEAATADISAEEEGRRDVLVSLLAEVARNYLTLREAQARLRIANENIEAQQNSVNITRARYDAGLTNASDALRAEAQLATTQSQIPAFETIVYSAIHRLSVLLGQNPASLFDELVLGQPLPPTPPSVPVGMPSDLLRRRADVRRAERELAGATARIGEAMADLFPKFSLTGNFGFQNSNAGDLVLGTSRFWGFGPTVSWPVFDAGRIRANIDVQNSRQEQAVFLYERTVKESLEDVENSLVAYAKEQQRFSLLGQAVGAERQAVTLANERYITGLSDFLNVLDAQRALYTAQDQQVQSQTTVLLNLVALYKALGGGWESFEIPNDETAALDRPE
ncbi:MAG: efflux transporter outer membrane subunit [Candidatus Hydrogenedentes bacterium]|nr:efflux transporter outer membrane subunit [Candidatus Hydrogenedentota bacterium]